MLGQSCPKALCLGQLRSQESKRTYLRQKFVETSLGAYGAIIRRERCRDILILLAKFLTFSRSATNRSGRFSNDERADIKSLVHVTYTRADSYVSSARGETTFSRLQDNNRTTTGAKRVSQVVSRTTAHG